MLGPRIKPRLNAANMKVIPAPRLESSETSDMTAFVITIKPK